MGKEEDNRLEDQNMENCLDPKPILSEFHLPDKGTRIKEHWSSLNLELPENCDPDAINFMDFEGLPVLNKVDLSNLSFETQEKCGKFAEQIVPCKQLCFPPLDNNMFQVFLNHLPLRTFSSIKILDLKHCRYISPLSLDCNLKNFPKLEEFISPYYFFPDMMDQTLEVFLDTIRGCSNLRSITLGCFARRFVYPKVCITAASVINKILSNYDRITSITVLLSDPLQEEYYRKFSTFNSIEVHSVVDPPPFFLKKPTKLNRSYSKLPMELDQTTFWDLKVLKSLTSSNSTKIRIAILDSGLHFQTTLAKKVVYWYSAVPNQHATLDVTNGHGTAMASLIVDETLGIAPDHVELVIIKVLSDENNVEEAWIIQGMKEARKQNPDIILLSVGVSTCSRELAMEVFDTLSCNTILICSGNVHNNSMEKKLSYPSRLGGQLCIGAHDSHGQRMNSSPMGRELDFMGLGSRLWVVSPNGGYEQEEGISFGSGLITGLAALILGFDRSQHGLNLINTTNDMRNVLLGMASNRGHHDQASGYGSLNPTEIFRENEEVSITKQLFYRSLGKSIKLEEISNNNTTISKVTDTENDFDVTQRLKEMGMNTSDIETAQKELGDLLGWNFN